MFVLKNIIRGTWLWSQEPDTDWYWRYRTDIEEIQKKKYKRLVVTWPPEEDDYYDYDYDYEDDYENDNYEDNNYNKIDQWKYIIKTWWINLFYHQDNYENTWSCKLTNWLYKGVNLTYYPYISPVFFVCEGPYKDRLPNTYEKLQIIIGGIIRRLLRR